MIIMQSRVDAHKKRLISFLTFLSSSYLKKGDGNSEVKLTGGVAWSRTVKLSTSGRE